MKRQVLTASLATFVAASLFISQVFTAAAATNSPGNSHGSNTIVTEDMLMTEQDIEAGYDVNPETQGSAEQGDYTKLFDHESIQDVFIDIDENNWNYMLQNAMDKPTVLTNSVTIGDQTISYAGIKTKGNLTLSSVWNSDSDRFSFTINFGKYIKKKNGYSETQNFYGLNKVALNNIYGDATLMKEYLSYELMTAMGVATPCYCLVNLYVNGEFWGVYMMVESIDSPLTQRTLGEESDYLVKPEAEGGDLVYDYALDQYLDEDGNFSFDVSDYPSDPSHPLYPYNGLWENDEETFADVIDMLPTVFQWMRQLNELSNEEDPNTEEYQQALESIMNVDEVLRYFAANTYLVNLDSYQSEKMQNYALYINENGKMSILPWDYNYSFGAYGVGSAEAMINFDISNPVINTTLTDRPLLNVLLQNDEYRATYEKYLEDCCIIASTGGITSDGAEYEEDYFTSIIQSYYTTLSATYANDPTAFYTLAQYTAATEGLEELNRLRAQAVQRQLAGDTSLVTTDLNLRTLGDVVGSGDIPGGDPSFETITLTDAETGLTVTGPFSPSAALQVISIAEGDEFEAAQALLPGTKLMGLYDVSIDQENGSGSSTPPDGEGNAPTPPDDEGNAPTPPDTDPSVREMTVTIPVTEWEDTSSLHVYLIGTDGSYNRLESIVQDGVITFTTHELGRIAITQGRVLKYGDINEDSRIDASDALLALQHSVKLITLTDEAYLAADVNGDDTINASDALYILQHSVKLIDQFPIEYMEA